MCPERDVHKTDKQECLSYKLEDGYAYRFPSD
jgi:hypothetical protein